MALFCPSCAAPMEEASFQGNYGNEVQVDLCHHCEGMWFDRLENVALSPGGIIALFRVMQEHRSEGKVLSDRMSCPRCSARLKKTFNMQRGVRYAYERCEQNHGHFITFFEFLREKHFIKPLDKDKLAELKTHVQQVNCSNCGAAIDLHKNHLCTHCGAPVSMLDKDAMADTLRELERKEARKDEKSQEEISADMMLERLRAERVFDELDRMEGRRQGMRLGLLEAALGALFRLT